MKILSSVFLCMYLYNPLKKINEYRIDLKNCNVIVDKSNQ